MNLSNDFKRDMLRATTAIIKKKNGRGPQNIYIKTMESECHIVVQGFKSDYENYFISRFGDEAVTIFRDFYHRDAQHIHQTFIEQLGEDHLFDFSHVIIDFDNDIYQVVVRL